MVGIGGDEHHGRRLGQGLHGVGQAQAVLAGHVDVQQQHVKAAPAGGAQQRQRFARVACFCHGGALAVGAVAQQGAQALAGQRFVVNDQDVHGAFGGVEGEAVRGVVDGLRRPLAARWACSARRMGASTGSVMRTW